MKFKMLQQSKAHATKDWEACDRLQKEMNTLRKDIFDSQQELTMFQSKERKAKWHKKKVKVSSNDGPKENQATLLQYVHEEVTETCTEAKDAETETPHVRNECETHDSAVVTEDSVDVAEQDLVLSPLRDNQKF